MGDISVFDSLAGELSAAERRELLERVLRSSGVSAEPLLAYDGSERRERVELEERLAGYGLIERILLFFRRLFTGRDLETVLRDDGLKAIAHAVEQRRPGIVDMKRNLVLFPLLEEVVKLKDAARFFYDVLERSFDRDKAAFFGFLGSFELPETHAALLAGTNPRALAAARPELDESGLRQAALQAWEEAFQALTDDRRKRMYQDLRCLLFMKRLAGFLFERCANTFKRDLLPGEDPAAPFSEIKPYLAELADILFSLSSPPSIALLESLFAWVEHESLERVDEEAEGRLRGAMAKGESALARIRAFNRQVPIFDLVRLVALDPDWQPQELPAAEDWLVVYRGFWKQRIERQLEEVQAELRYRKLEEEIRSFGGDAEVAGFLHVSRKEEGDSPPVTQELALSFLLILSKGAFARELNRPLKIVLVDGEFYRKDNRLEFTDAYNTLSRCEDILKAFDTSLGPEGELGKAWNLARTEASSLSIKRRKLQSIARGADEEAVKIIRDVGTALAELVRVLRGILKGEAGGRYDSLANLSYLDGKANKEFLRSLASAKDRAERALGLLSELSGLTLDSPGT